MGAFVFFSVLSVADVCLAASAGPVISDGKVNFRAMIHAGGFAGYIAILLSVATLAMTIEHLLSIRRKSLVPPPLIENVHRQLSHGKVVQAQQLCKESTSLLAYIIQAGLQEARYGYAAAEKAMEDALVEQSSRLLRKIEYLSVIGTVAPMVGLLGTVWGMILAFAEFASKANPTPADFAPAISEALVSTMFGLCVAIPAMSIYAWFRNRVDEFVAEAALAATYATSPLREKMTERSVSKKTVPTVAGEQT